MLSFTPSLSRSPFCAVSAFPSYVILIASEHNTNSDRLTVPDSSLKQFPVSDILIHMDPISVLPKEHVNHQP